MIKSTETICFRRIRSIAWSMSYTGRLESFSKSFPADISSNGLATMAQAGEETNTLSKRALRPVIFGWEGDGASPSADDVNIMKRNIAQVRRGYLSLQRRRRDMLSVFRRPPQLYRGPLLAGGSDNILFVRDAVVSTPLKDVGGLVVDARKVRSLEKLRRTHTTISSWIRDMRSPGGRLIFLLDEEDRMGLSAYAASAAREIGSRGCTANVLRGADASAIRFLLSGRAACISRCDLSLKPRMDDEQTPDSFDERLESCLDEDQEGLISAKGVRYEPRVRDAKIVVTGADGGIGRAISDLLEKSGASLVLLDKEVDLRDRGAAAAVADKVTDAFDGPPDVLVHCAGLTRDRTLAKMTDADFDDCLRVNYEAPTEIDDILRPRRSLVFSSVVGIHGNFGQANYAAAKRALIAYASRSNLREDRESDRRPSLRFCIAPGYVETAMTQKLPFFHRLIGSRLNTLQQPVLPRDVAHAAAFLCSSQGDALRGQPLRVCAGSLMA